MRPGRFVLMLGAASVAVACATLGGLSGGEPGDDAGRLTDAEPETASGDGGSTQADADAGVTDPDACGGRAGPAMVRVGAYCIDSTEVTYVQYKQFLEANFADAGGLMPPECSWVKSLNPYSGWPYPAGRDDYPVPDVTWCAARAYCVWAGKRLCGAPGTGAPVNVANINISTADEWYAACSDGGALAYPYGNAYVKGACNGDLDGGYNVPVMSKPACKGGFPGLWDMSGNAEEWENACEETTAGDAGSKDVCYARGGTFASSAVRLSCTSSSRLYRSNTAGIRCCL